MNPKTFFMILFHLALAGAVLFLSHYGHTWIAVVVVLAPVALTWFRQGRNINALLLASPTAIVGLSAVVLIGISRQPLGQLVFPVATQMILTLLYASWLVWVRHLQVLQQSSFIVTTIQQIAAIIAIFLAAAFWHWPDGAVVSAVWAAVMVSSLWYLKMNGERSATILAGAWALVAAEIAWILYTWQVNYILLGGYFIVPQAALVILGVGYCFASIYHTHKDKRLSRRRLIEYVAISAALLAIVIAGTRWNGTA